MITNGFKPLLVRTIQGHLITGWKCSGCDWGFPIPEPVPVERYDFLLRKMVQQAFAAHDCEAERLPLAA